MRNCRDAAGPGLRSRGPGAGSRERRQEARLSSRGEGCREHRVSQGCSLPCRPKAAHRSGRWVAPSCCPHGALTLFLLAECLPLSQEAAAGWWAMLLLFSQDGEGHWKGCVCSAPVLRGFCVCTAACVHSFTHSAPTPMLCTPWAATQAGALPWGAQSLGRETHLGSECRSCRTRALEESKWEPRVASGKKDRKGVPGEGMDSGRRGQKVGAWPRALSASFGAVGMRLQVDTEVHVLLHPRRAGALCQARLSP